jgi:hypothetical protein
LAEDLFLPLFMRRVSEPRFVSIEAGGLLRDIYASFWRVFDGAESNQASLIVADGSLSSTTFRGGVRAVYVRAIANTYDGGRLVGRLPEVRVRVGHRLRRATLYMRAAEFDCLRGALDGCRGGGAAVCDGNIYPAIHPTIVGGSRQEAEALTEYLEALYRLYEASMERGVLLLGVAKDSFVNYLRARIIASRISEIDPDLGSELSRERSMKNIASRIGEAAERAPKTLGDFLREAMRPTSDEEALEECTSSPGFTAPLMLAPQPIYLGEEIKAGTINWWGSRIRARLRMRRRLRGVSEALDRVYSLPPVVMFYWRPWHGLGVYRVDVGGWAFGVDREWGGVEGDSFMPEEAAGRCIEIVAMLNSLSPSPFAVKPLVDADALVRLSQRTYKECYEPMLVSCLRMAGLRALPTKRDLRELYG